MSTNKTYKSNEASEKRIQFWKERDEDWDLYEQEANAVSNKIIQGQTVDASTFTPLTHLTKLESSDVDNIELNTLTQLEAAKGGGLPLEKGIKNEMEEKMNTNLSNVRVHTGDASSRINKDNNAKAVTYGQDIHFNEGNYNPDSSEGKELLAHELVHTRQQMYEDRKVQKQPNDIISHLNSPLFKGITELEDVYEGKFVIGRKDKDVDSIGARGEYVRVINEALLALYPGQYDSIKKDLDYFSKTTKKAVKRFQEDSGLDTNDIDGIVGSKTLKILDAYNFQKENDTVTMAFQGKASHTNIQFEDDKDWEPIALNDAIFSFRSGSNFYFSEVNAYKVPAAESNEPLLGVFPLGRGATRVVATGNGTAIIIDSGTGSSYKDAGGIAIYNFELDNLMARFGLTETSITEAWVTHQHLDHINMLVENIKKYQIRAENLKVSAVFAGKKDKDGKNLREVLRSLLPTLPETRLLGYENFEYMELMPQERTGEKTFTYQRTGGNVVFTFLVNKDANQTLVQEYENKGSEGKVVATHLEDAASEIIRIQKIGTEFRMVVLGDLRGKDYGELYEKMESDNKGSWAEFFSNVTVLEGLQHHLGVVNTVEDFEGIKRVLEVTLLKNGRLSVLIQSKEGPAQKFMLEAFARMGVTVYMAGNSQGTTMASSLAALSNGEIESVGPGIKTAENGPTYEEIQINMRMAELTEYNEAFKNADPELLKEPKFAEMHEKVLESYSRLKQLWDERFELTVGRGVPNKGKGQEKLNEKEMDPNLMDLEKLEQNKQELLKPLSFDTFRENNMEYVEFIEALVQIAKQSREIELIPEHTTSAYTEGREMTELIMAATPQFTRAFLATNPNISYARLVSVLEAQASAEALVHNAAGATTARGYVSAGFMFALMVFNDVVVPIMEANRQKNRIKDEKLRKAWSILLWWFEKGVTPDYIITDKNDKTYDSKSEEMPKLKAEDIKGITIKGISEEALTRFNLWFTFNVRNFDDFFNNFILAPPHGVSYAAPDPSHPDYNYAGLIFSLNLPKWENGVQTFEAVENKELTVMMQEQLGIMIRDTQIQLDLLYQESTTKKTEEKKQDVHTYEQPVFKPATQPLSEETDQSISQPIGKGAVPLVPLRKLKFIPGVKKVVYSRYNQQELAVDWQNSEPLFFEIDDPEKHVAFDKESIVKYRGNYDLSEYYLIIGGDYNSYSKLKHLQQPLYSTVYPVRMPIKTVNKDVWGMGWDEKMLDQRQKDARDAVDDINDNIDAKWDPDGSNDDSGGYIHFPGKGINTSGIALVKKTDVEEVKSK